MIELPTMKQEVLNDLLNAISKIGLFFDAAEIEELAQTLESWKLGGDEADRAACRKLAEAVRIYKEQA